MNDEKNGRKEIMKWQRDKYTQSNLDVVFILDECGSIMSRQAQKRCEIEQRKRESEKEREERLQKETSGATNFMGQITSAMICSFI